MNGTAKVVQQARLRGRRRRRRRRQERLPGRPGLHVADRRRRDRRRAPASARTAPSAATASTTIATARPTTARRRHDVPVGRRARARRACPPTASTLLTAPMTMARRSARSTTSSHACAARTTATRRPTRRTASTSRDGRPDDRLGRDELRRRRRALQLDLRWHGHPVLRHSRRSRSPTVAAGAYYFVVDGYSTRLGHVPDQHQRSRSSNGASCDGAARARRRDHLQHGLRVQGHARARAPASRRCAPTASTTTTRRQDRLPVRPGLLEPGGRHRSRPDDAAGLLRQHRQRHRRHDGLPERLRLQRRRRHERSVLHRRDRSDAAITTKTTDRHDGGQGERLHDTTCQSASSAPGRRVRAAAACPGRNRSRSTRSARAFDTVLSVRDTHVRASSSAATTTAGGTGTSKLTMTNVSRRQLRDHRRRLSAAHRRVHAECQRHGRGGHVLHFPLFTGGANAVLVCPAGTTCTGTPAKCQ